MFRIRYRAVCVLQWCGPGEGPRVPAAPPSARRGAQVQAARHLGDSHDLLWCGRHPGAHPCAAHRPLQHGRGAHQLQGPGQSGVEGWLPSVTCCVVVSVLCCVSVLRCVASLLYCVVYVLCCYGCAVLCLCCSVSILCLCCVVLCCSFATHTRETLLQLPHYKMDHNLL